MHTCRPRVENQPAVGEGAATTYLLDSKCLRAGVSQRRRSVGGGIVHEITSCSALRLYEGVSYFERVDLALVTYLLASSHKSRDGLREAAE